MIKISLLLIAFVAISQSTPISSGPNDSFQIEDYLEITKNDYQNNELTNGRSLSNDSFENYFKSHDFTVKLPIIDSSISFTARNLDKDEIDVKLNLSSDKQITEGRKSKLKKIIAPIFVFILLKAMVLIPLALGVLAIKTWNALQLSFVSFVIAIALGVWQLCKKVVDIPAPIIAHHDPWTHVGRSIDAGNRMAYSAHLQEN